MGRGGAGRAGHALSGAPAPVADPRAPLLAWWADHGRHHLPWRATRDPWAVLVSELMLQQTQVERVAGRWARFLERFPTPAACADAPAADVITEWAGLGYNGRAVRLHRCARQVVAEHGGRLPADLAALLALPGIGPYTARAVRVFAHGLDGGLVDTTAGRVLARALAGRALTPSAAQAAADAVAPRGESWAWCSAVFDLAALVCTRRDPRCDVCPLAAAGACAWAAAGHPHPDPVLGSAGISRRQAPLEGSDRQGRARLVDAARRAPVPAADVPAACGWPDDPSRAAAAVRSLVRDGLVEVTPDGSVRLPR